MIVRIVPIASVVSKYFETIRTTGVIGNFHMISSPSPQRQETRGRQRCLWVRQQNFCAYFANKPHKWMIFVRKANLVPWYLLFLLILRHWEATRVPRRHSISSKPWCHDGLSLISNNPHTRCEHLCIIFSASAPSGPNLFSITGIKVMTSGIAFDRPDRLSGLRAFPYNRFKIYMIVPIVRIELNSIQAIEVVSVVRFVCDRLGGVSIWSSRASEHFLRRLGRSGPDPEDINRQWIALKRKQPTTKHVKIHGPYSTETDRDDQ